MGCSLTTISIPKLKTKLEKIESIDKKRDLLVWAFLKARSSYKRNAIEELLKEYPNHVEPALVIKCDECGEVYDVQHEAGGTDTFECESCFNTLYGHDIEMI